MTDDIKALREALKDAKDGPMEWAYDAHPDRIARVLDEVERLREDAERYRWFRAQCRTRTNLVQYNEGQWQVTKICNCPEDMDAAIDAARKDI